MLVRVICGEFKTINIMKKLALLLVGVLGTAFCTFAKSTTEPVDYVSPLVGTQSKHALSTGNTYPAIAMPWGMNREDGGWMGLYL